MSSVGLNKWIVSGNLAADAEIRTVELKSGEKAKVAKATIYVRKSRSRDESFTVRLSIWEGSTAWRKLPFLKKGSLIICTGSVEPSPYMSNSDNSPRAGLEMTVLDIDLDTVRNAEEEGEEVPVELAAPKVVALTPAKAADSAATAYQAAAQPRVAEPLQTATPAQKTAQAQKAAQVQKATPAQKTVQAQPSASSPPPKDKTAAST